MKALKLKLVYVTLMIFILSADEAAALTPPTANDVSNPESNSVVRVLGCTGTLIAPQIVITAAHCLEMRGLGVPPPPGASIHSPGGFWEVPGRWYPLTTAPGGIQISFGADRNNPILQRRATRYNRAGYADIIMFASTKPVPASVAAPSRVMTAIPGGENPVRFFQNKNFQMVGWGRTNTTPTPRFRQTAGARFAAYPHVSFGYSRPNQMRVRGAGGSTFMPGDSGGPLFWRDSSGTRWLVGVGQGTEPGGGRYFATWGRGGRDGQGDQRPSLAGWIDRIQVLANWCNHGTAERLYGDFDGDDYDGTLCHDTKTGQKWIANHGGRQVWEDSTNRFCSHSGAELHIGDFNADGRADLLCHDTNTGKKWIDLAERGQYFTGVNWQDPSNRFCGHSGAELHVGDFNGDGRADLLCHDTNTGKKWIDFAERDRYFTGVNWQDPSNSFCSHSGAELHVGDFNGDNRADLLCHDTKTGKKWIDFAERDRYFTGVNWQDPSNRFCSHSGAKLYVLDYNTDNYDDLLCVSGGYGESWVLLADIRGGFTFKSP